MQNAPQDMRSGRQPINVITCVPRCAALSRLALSSDARAFSVAFSHNLNSFALTSPNGGSGRKE